MEVIVNWETITNQRDIVEVLEFIEKVGKRVELLKERIFECTAETYHFYLY